MEPSLHDISMQKISNGEQAHPLMMGHPASYQLMTCPPEPAPGRTIVRSFVEAIFAEPTQIGHSPQIPQCASTVNVQGEKSGVRRNDEPIDLTFAHCKVRKPESVILVISSLIKFEIG